MQILKLNVSQKPQCSVILDISLLLPAFRSFYGMKREEFSEIYDFFCGYSTT